MNNRQFDIDIAGVRSKLTDSLGLWYPDPDSSKMAARFVSKKQYRWSWHLLFEIVDSRAHRSQKILVKCLKRLDNIGRDQNEYRSADNAQLLEYKALSLLYDNFGSGQFKGVTAIRPLMHFPKLEALAMEHISAKNILSMLFAGAHPLASRLEIQKVIDIAEHLGQFTAEIHKIRQDDFPHTAPFDGKGYFADLQSNVDALLALGVDSNVWRGLEDTLNAVRRHLRAVQDNVVFAYLHSDLQMANFLKLDDGRICTIDTALEFTGPVEQDVGNFLAITETPKRRVVLGSVATRRSVLKSVAHSFLAGYSRRGCYSTRVLHLYRLLAFTRRWARMLDILQRRMPNPISPAFQRIRINPFMLRCLSSICKDI